jgi:protein TonB
MGTVIPEQVKGPPVLMGANIDPRYANNFQPTYPPDQIREGNTGRVIVRVLIGVDGRVKDIEKVSTPSDSFWEATKRQALSKWRFKPATRDGEPYETWKIMNVSFVLNQDQ